MAKGDAQKKAGVMAKEWWKSKSNEQTIEDLVTVTEPPNLYKIKYGCPR